MNIYRIKRIAAMLMAGVLLAASPTAVYADVTSGPGASSAEQTAESAAYDGEQTSSQDTDASVNAQTLQPTASEEAIRAAAAQYAAPQINSGAAVLMDAATGTVIYGSSEDTPMYPASITKLMTAILVYERCSLDDKVTFSYEAVSDLESGAVTAGISEGDVLTVRDCLYALLLKSANEVANGLAEHVGGSVSGFATLMNERARELGCTNTNFCNPNGLTDSSHVVSARDMALIARAFFSYPELVSIDTTPSYTLPPTKKYPGGLTVSLKHKMLIQGGANYYEYAIGGKTGYTTAAGNTLVTAAQKDGVRLIAVVMKAKSGQHYAETKLLFDYGWQVMQTASAQMSEGPSVTSAADSGTGTAADMSETAAESETQTQDAVRMDMAPGESQGADPDVSGHVVNGPGAQ